MAFTHETVLLNETVASLQLKPNGVYVDATLGGGGHSELILSKLAKNGHLFAFDQDEEAITNGKKRLAPYVNSGQVTFIKDNFRNLSQALAQHQVNQIDGIIYDLGVSSPQFDEAARGFSYKLTAPLDMRMDQSAALTAREIVNDWPYADLERILYRYGEDKFAKRVARAIERDRAVTPIETTTQLAETVKHAIPAAARRKGGHPAKRTFQAIRIAVNDELGAAEESLEAAIKLLNVNGRIAVITFQSLEDRLVRTIFRDHARTPEIPRGLPIMGAGEQAELKIITKKPILPTATEIEKNRRSRSAQLRVAEKQVQK
ncbi:16S rRNA (cytosine(1402)-N(4))-methyltransferase RsmH [Loigolactobacillus backii]|uniref:Ribosomal RNA small subunit methyltransferase H n=1 Tax=Loigolactobacillus backii TaxID=375175 RepID=A0A192H4H3_9LACO|nr:16S rRNA (cytosine(1402)-N(4))-methyltransferase RsmH [Loigolactobacillus backii]ANK59747.1 16S rRNA (cytosine(1402)-N(4))-methyltransferase [Loigolactobacillus backii]ANK63148.1 16S rRNA (cytosine(1402)-N(4))-methyltransferase [Loigolactobacillus backii]ANK64742.1 16S rRNA (cytosine(1402)-N(4))-methyltransferase [Loigolactobacillus backii]ANK66809.1 16S rRNA (cytosine(1402)-N(4))-methyltransferase [Loigolactobacillus backii]ANK69844.1 16S rRNA (cytosine(1402)-N(4))-methyltransferase [Loigo